MATSGLRAYFVHVVLNHRGPSAGLFPLIDPASSPPSTRVTAHLHLLFHNSPLCITRLSLPSRCMMSATSIMQTPTSSMSLPVGPGPSGTPSQAAMRVPPPPQIQPPTAQAGTKRSASPQKAGEERPTKVLRPTGKDTFDLRVRRSLLLGEKPWLMV